MDAAAKVREVAAVFFCVLFCWLFLDRFLFRGQLAEICFGRQCRWLAGRLRSMAERVDMPLPQEEESPPQNTEPVTEKSGDLVPRHSYSVGQTRSTPANKLQGEQPASNAPTFAPPTPPAPLPGMFTDRTRFEWMAQPNDLPRTPSKPATPAAPEQNASAETDGPEEEVSALGCAQGLAQDGGQGIGPQELDMIIALCNGKSIPADKREAIVRAIRNIRGTQIHRSLLESINGSDNRIANFLDEAEREAAGDEASSTGGGIDRKRFV